MGPNNLDNTQNSEEPMAFGPQPMGPEPQSMEQPMQPMEQPMQPMGQPMQPMGQPIQQPTQSMMNPLQPDTQPIELGEKPKPKTNFVMVGIIAGVAVLLAVVAIVVVLNLGNKKSAPPAPIVDQDTEAEGIVPTPELAKSVCEKYNGQLVIFEGEEVVDDYKEVESRYVCQRYKNAQQEGDTQVVTAYTGDDFVYQVDFVKEDKVDERWTRLKTANKTSGNKILEDSDDVMRVHNSMSGAGGVTVETDMVIYKDATVAISTYNQNNPLAEEILNELGFVNDEENGDESKSGSSNTADIQREKDYSSVIIAINSYMASNNGKISNMVKDADPQTLTASKWVNDSGKDPNGDPYNISAYSFNKWSGIGQPAPSGENGSQIFVIINANCTGKDENGFSMPAADAGVRSFAVYGYLENGYKGYFCQASGSAER